MAHSALSYHSSLADEDLNLENDESKKADGDTKKRASASQKKSEDKTEDKSEPGTNPKERKHEKTIAEALRIAGGVAIAGASWSPKKKTSNGQQMTQAMAAAYAANRWKKKVKKTIDVQPYSIAKALTYPTAVAIAGIAWTPQKPKRNTLKGVSNAVIATQKANTYASKKHDYSIAKGLKIAGAIAIAGLSWTAKTKQSTDEVEQVEDKEEEEEVDDIEPLFRDACTSPIEELIAIISRPITAISVPYGRGESPSPLPMISEGTSMSLDIQIEHVSPVMAAVATPNRQPTAISIPPAEARTPDYTPLPSAASQSRASVPSAHYQTPSPKDLTPEPTTRSRTTVSPVYARPPTDMTPDIPWRRSVTFTPDYKRTDTPQLTAVDEPDDVRRVAWADPATQAAPEVNRQTVEPAGVKQARSITPVTNKAPTTRPPLVSLSLMEQIRAKSKKALTVGGIANIKRSLANWTYKS